MRPPLAPSLARAATAGLFCLSLAAPACGDDSGGDDDDNGTTVDASPEVDGAVEGVAIEGLSDPVDVYFDELGILHAKCQTDEDCYAVEGYYHAAHRFAQMDIRRRLARGKLSELVPLEPVFELDKSQRQLMMSRTGVPLEEQLFGKADERTRAALAAYSKGVNAWLADLAAGRNGAVLADEYGFELLSAEAIQDDWEPLDSVACILPLMASLTESSGVDIAAGNLYAALGPTLMRDLYPLAPPSPSVIQPPIEPAGKRAARAVTRAERRLRDRLVRARPLLERALRQMPEVSLDRSSLGSNNWVVGPTLTTGGALLANDPHLQMSHPAIWYLVHLDARGDDGGIHIAGASFAGMPGIILGHNDDIAWGATTTYFDATDVYVETLSKDRSAVLFDGKEVPIQQVEYTFHYDGEDVTASLPFVPHHGPIITPITEKDTSALSVRWTGQDADTDVNFFLALGNATSVEEARVALENVTSAGQNFVVIDRAGHIGWFPYNRLPSRPWMSADEAPPWMPLPGTGDFEWGPSIPLSKLPQAIDPEEGFLATANNDMTGALQDGDPTNDGLDWIQGYADEGYRHQRIVERLRASNQHDMASMQSIQGDVHSLLGELLTPTILATADRDTLDADGLAVWSALNGWDFECPTGLTSVDPTSAVDPNTAASARGCAAFHVFWAKLRILTFADDLAAAAPDLADQQTQPAAMINALVNPKALTRDYWDNVSTEIVETERDIVDLAFRAAGAALRAKAGGDPAEWVWGRLHTLTLIADLFGSFGIDTFNSPAFANDGGLFTVDVANPANEPTDDYTQVHGPSMRFVCKADEPGIDCTIELPGGQRHDRSSPFFNSMLENWLTNRPAEFRFSIDDAAAAAAETVQVKPR